MKANIVISVGIVALATAASASINFSGSAITNIGGAGTTWAPGSLSVWVLDTNNDGFGGAVASSLNAGDSLAAGASFGGADDLIMFTNQTFGGGTTAVVNGSTFNVPAGGTVGDDWGIFVFDTDTFGQTVLADGGTYGFFTNTDWELPGDPSSWTFTGATPGVGQFQSLSGVTGSTFSVVPEPSAYAALSGLLALGYVMVRRSRA